MNVPAQTNPAKFDPDKLRLLVRVGVFRSAGRSWGSSSSLD